MASYARSSDHNSLLQNPNNANSFVCKHGCTHKRCFSCTSAGGGGAGGLFGGNWYCCVCKANFSGILQNPNSANSAVCENRCTVTSCPGYPNADGSGGDGGGGGHDPSITLPQKAAVSDAAVQPRIPVRDETENAAGEPSPLRERRSSYSSQSSNTKHRTASSSTHNTRVVTEAQTDPTTVTEVARNAHIKNLRASDDDNESVASSVDQFYPGVSTVLSNNLAQDLKDVDLAQSRDMLTGKLKEFSLRFGNENGSENYRRMMSIVYRHSRRIAAQICCNTSEAQMEDLESSSDGSKSDTSEQNATIVKWLENTEVSPNATPDEKANADGGADDECEDDEGEDGDSEDELASGHKILLESEAYQWLVSVMQRTVLLSGTDPSCMVGHRENVSRQLQSVSAQEAHNQKLHKLVTSKRPPPRYIARFVLSWDPLMDLREDYEGESPAEIVGQVVTLTGDGHSVQAATCRGYLEQVWPTTGSGFMDLVENMMTRAGQGCKYLLPDLTEVSARLDAGTCVIEAFGTQSGLGDVAEQLLWISTALRKPSGVVKGMTLCSAELVPTTTLAYEPTLLHKTLYQQCLGVVAFRVVYSANPPPEGTWSTRGDCWMELFPSCPVVIGYPIPSRNPQRPGLEIPLDIMAALIGADQITPFGHDLIIKGYSDLFYATEHHGNFTMWHLICNERNPEFGGARISFADERITQSTDQGLARLSLKPDDLRHIVGWTNTVKSNAGAPDVEYGTLSSSNLRKPEQGWALDRVQITAGQYITVSTGFIRGKKAKPVHMIQDDYVSRLLDIRETQFILCDVGTRKAWLVNGLSTLLHLVRSHFAYAENDKLRQSILLSKASHLRAEGGRNGLKAAFDTLRSDRNRMLRLHRKGGTSQIGNKEKEKEEYYYLEDLVKSLLHSLEQIVDHQSDFRSEQSSAGYRIKTSPWEQLEGYDFMDVAKTLPRIPSCGMKLRHDGEGWSQLTRALGAPTLFGQHFGELLEPASTSEEVSVCAACHWNDVMPPGRDLLAVQMEDILKADREYEGCGILHLADELCLDVPPSLFQPCPRDSCVPCHDRDRILCVQRASANVPESIHPDAQSKALVVLKEWLGIKWAPREVHVENTDAGPSQSSSTTKSTTTGGILLGKPRESSEKENQKGRGFLQGLLRKQPWSPSEPTQVQVSAPSSISTTASNSWTSRAPIESTPLTPPSTSGALLNCTGDLLDPGSVSSTSSQPSVGDYHRRRRARQREESKL